MANTTNVNIRMDADLKRQFEAFCADMGMSMTTAFNIFAKKAVREYRIPFEIGREMPNAENIYGGRSDDGGTAFRCIISGQPQNSKKI